MTYHWMSVAILRAERQWGYIPDTYCSSKSITRWIYSSEMWEVQSVALEGSSAIKGSQKYADMWVLKENLILEALQKNCLCHLELGITTRCSLSHINKSEPNFVGYGSVIIKHPIENVTLNYWLSLTTGEGGSGGLSRRKRWKNSRCQIVTMLVWWMM